MVLAVIEDDPAICEAMRTLLLGWACRPFIVADSDAAIALLDAAGLAPEALLADWRLAGPENGLQAIQRLCQRYGPRPAAIVTGEIDLAGLEVPPQLSLHVMQKPLRAREIGEWLLHARAMT
jgi:two-component system, sensor histidine kinase